MTEIYRKTQETTSRILITGGYGVFGSGIAEQLAGEAELWIAGRHGEKATLYAEQLAAKQAQSNHHTLLTITGVELNVSQPAELAGFLFSHAIDLVIHCCGPFQGQQYTVAEVCITAGCHYIDLADGREFVAGITSLNARAKQAGVSVISGASSVPGLSSAVVDELSRDMQQLTYIDTAIAPGNRVPRGLATVTAVLGYIGKPIPAWHQGRWQSRRGWKNNRKINLGRFGQRRVANCDVPDLTLFPARYPGVQSVRFQAGLELHWLHFSLLLLATMTQLTGLSWRRWAKPFTAIAGWFINAGTGDGGMRVDVRGTDQHGETIEKSWVLTAGSGHGPKIPGMAAVILARKLIAGEEPLPQATPCLGLFTEEEFRATAKPFDIQCAVTTKKRPDA